MRSFFFYFLIVLACTRSQAQDPNFVRLRILTKAGETDTATANALSNPFDVQQSSIFYDGLGRPIQSVSKQASPLQKDMVSLQAYDIYGREVNKYLPYVSSSTTGGFKTSALTEQVSFNAAQFPSDTIYRGKVSYEASPLNRPLTVYAPGNSWVGAGRGVGSQYLVNTTADSVRIWTIAAAAGSLPATAASFAAGALYENVTTDEAGHQVVAYQDLQGKVLLKKVQLGAAPAAGPSGWLNTYYIYDDLDNLRFVIPPKATEWLLANSWNFGATNGTTVVNELCFRYEYDARKHLLIKKIPGAGEVWMIYDVRDRLVMSQDSVLRGQHKWMFTRYDTQNRPDSTGLITDPTNYNNLAYHLGQAAGSANYPVVSSYTNELLTQNYYDDYGWTSAAGLPSSMATNYTSSNTYFITTYNTSPSYAVPVTAHPITRGLATGTMTKVVGTTSQYLYAVNFYDDRGQIVQAQSSNYSGGIDTLTMQYDFSGKPLRTLLNHRKNGNTVQNHTVLTKLSYDAGLRLKNIYKNIDNLGDQLIDSLRYNELGQVQGKYLGNALDSLLYAYNIRGWLTTVNKNYLTGAQRNYFGMELSYDRNTSVTGSTYAGTQFNGNIGGTTWKGGDGVPRRYDFSYDNVNRLTKAAFTQNATGTWDSSVVNFSVSNLTYDANGNILTMNQAGFKINSSALIDQLTYSVPSTSNKLNQVSDVANDSLSILGDFRYKGNKQATDYGYDGNGSLTHDNNKGIDTIVYNYLNLPQKVHMKGKGNIVYTYDATGSKLSKVTTDSLSKHTTTTLYLGSFVYQQRDTITNPAGGVDTMQFLLHEEGRVRWAFHRYTTGAIQYKWEYDFFEKDHLGNTRAVLTQQRDTGQYLATMEAAYRATENALFYNIGSTNVWSGYVNGAGNNPFGTGVTSPNDSVCRISGSTPKEGPAIILKVMAGDYYKVGVQGFWKSGQTATGTTDALQDILNSLASGILSVAGSTKGSFSSLSNINTSPLLGGVSSFRTANNPTPGTNPKAYLNYIALDDQFNYDPNASGAQLLGGPDTLRTLGTTDTIRIKKNGYLYIYLTNETKSVSVFFDNLSVTHYSGPLLEENHYYPFGLTMAGISDRALKGGYEENKFRYNDGSELQNKEFSDVSGLELYATDHRLYDPQLGRFVQVDAYADEFEPWSPYTYANDNPILLNDPSGLLSDSTHPQERAPVTVTHAKAGISNNVIFADLRPVRKNPYFILGGNRPAYIPYTPGGTWDPEKTKQFVKIMGTGISLIPIGRGLKSLYTLYKVVQYLKDAEQQAEIASKSLKELQEIVKKDAPLFRELFGVNETGSKAALDNIKNLEVPEGLSQQSMQAYRELINRVPDPRGTQAIRAKILDALLNK